MAREVVALDRVEAEASLLIKSQLDDARVARTDEHLLRPAALGPTNRVL